MMKTKSVQDLKQQLADMQLKRGDILVVHSSLRAVGKLAHGADTLLSALMETVEAAGVLMMPTFSYCYEGRPGVTPYCNGTTPSETGALTEVFRTVSGVVRSGHPTHSVAVWGAFAQELAQQEAALPPFDPCTPLHRAAMLGGKILLIGVGHESNSTIHVGESLAGLPFLDTPSREEYGRVGIAMGEHGIPLRHTYQRFTGCSLRFPAVEQLPLFSDVGQCIAPLGGAVCRLLSAKALLDFLVPQLRAQPELLLCEEGTCSRCDRRWKRLRTPIEREKP